jgi:hypothetical protein
MLRNGQEALQVAEADTVVEHSSARQRITPDHN